MSDWLKLHRSLQENEFWFSERFTKAQAWVDLLLLASYKPRTVFLRGVAVKLQPGELCYSQRSLAQRWGWNVKAVSTFLLMLRKRDMVTIQTDNVTTIISITNWNFYQSQGEQNGHQRGDQQGEQKETKQETNKEGTEGKEGKKVHEERCSPHNGSHYRSQQQSLNEQTAPEPQAPVPKSAQSPVRAFEVWWAEEYQRRFGAKYLFNYGKEGKLIRNMLKACDEDLEVLKRKAAAFLDSSDKFIQEAGYTIGVFYSRFNALSGGAVSQANLTRGAPEQARKKPFGITETQRILAMIEL